MKWICIFLASPRDPKYWSPTEEIPKKIGNSESHFAGCHAATLFKPKAVKAKLHRSCVAVGVWNVFFDYIIDNFNFYISLSPNDDSPPYPVVDDSIWHLVFHTSWLLKTCKSLLYLLRKLVSSSPTKSVVYLSHTLRQFNIAIENGHRNSWFTQ